MKKGVVFLDKILKDMSKVFDRMFAMIDIYGGPKTVSDNNVETYLDPIFYLIYCIDMEKTTLGFADVEFVTYIYTELIPQEVPYPLDYLPFSKQALQDFYFFLYKENKITKKQYQNMMFMFVSKQEIFFSRMSRPQFWSPDKKNEMLHMMQPNVAKEEKNKGQTAITKKAITNHENTSNVVLFPNKKSQEFSLSEKSSTLCYQLRVDLIGYKPPIWRRLILPAAITFETLHELLLITFEWSGLSEEYRFEVTDKQYLGNPSYFSVQNMLSPESEISTVFDQFAEFEYVYDFSDFWAHKIVVEKRITAEDAPNFSGPVCIKALRDTPIEGSKGAEIWEPLDLEILNEELTEYWEIRKKE